MDKKEKAKTPKNFIVKKDAFICEICHCITPIECEGSEPNTCAACMPLNYGKNGDNSGEINSVE